MTWALKRQLFYSSVVIGFILAFGFLIIYPQFKKPPTCSDGKQNGTETGVDCGGSCLRACLAETDPISIVWSRSFRVVPGRYNAVAYLENKNRSSVVGKINYRFRFADANNVYIGKREGSTYVPGAGKFVVFEPAIDIGNSVPVYTTFEFTSVPAWVQVSTEKLSQLKVAVSDIKLSNPDTLPKLTARLKNNSLFTLPEIAVAAILYDANHNAVSASRSYLDSLAGSEEAEVSFTWPEAFPDEIVATEIIPMYNVLKVKLEN